MKPLVEYQSFYQALEKTTTITVASLAAALLFAIIIYNQIHSVLILYWFAFMAVQQLLRQVFAQYYLKKNADFACYDPKDKIRYGFWLLLTALGWAVLGPLFIATNLGDAVIMYTVVFIIGLLAGTIFSLATVSLYFFMFTSVVALPLIISFVYVKEYELALVVLVFFLFTIKSSREIRTSVISSLEFDLQKSKLIEDLQQANKLKSEFLANMSHEIRTPMNAILGFIQILQRDEQDKEKLEYLSTVASSSQDLMQIIDDILDFSKIESNQLAIEKITFNPRQRIQQSIQLYKQQAINKDVNVELQFSHDLPDFIESDPTRLLQVVNNLLSNAIKFSPEHKQIAIKVGYDQLTEKMHFTIKDQGIGISKEKLNDIFEPFTQADNSTTRQFGGTGLGLSICKGLVEKLGGSIKVQSEIGRGSQFTFDIKAPAAKQLNKVSAHKSTPSVEKMQGHILIVEDNKTNQLLISKLIERVGLSYDIANDGLEAIDMYKQGEYDLVLMDENMPNMNGIEATNEIRKIQKQRNKAIPVIALTANSLKGDRERFLAAGMDEYLSKPIDVPLLYKTLKSFL